MREPHPSVGSVMIYTFFFFFFITLFLLLGALALYGFLELKRDKYPVGWTCYQHVIILAAIAVICLIAAILFGAQIPECYV